MRCGLNARNCITDHWCPVLSGRATSTDGTWTLICPVCRERKLSVSAGKRQPIVWTCHRGCEITRDALLAAGIRETCITGRAPGRHRKPGESAELKQIRDFITDEKLPAAALRLGLLLELGLSAQEARRLLRLTKTTYYRAMSQIPTRR